MNVPTTGGTPSPDPTAPDPQAAAPDPNAGFHPDALQQNDLNNGSGFSPDEIQTPAAPEGPGRWDTFMAKLQLAAIDSPTATLTRQFMEPSRPSQTEMAKGGILPDNVTPAKPKLSPDEANKLYPGMPKPFDEPVDPDAAARVAAVQKRRSDLQAIIAQGPELGRGLDTLVGAAAGATAGSLGGIPGAVAGGLAGGVFAAVGGSEGVIVGALDPLNLALMAATGGLAKPIGVLGQNLVINAASSGLSAPQRIKERQDVTLGGEAKNVVLGAIGSTAVHVVAGLATGRYSQAEHFARQADPGTQKRMLTTAISQHEAGANVDVSPTTYEMQARASGETAPGAPKTYEFKPVDHPSDRTFYAARAAGSDTPIEFQDLGPGVHAVDDGQIANNLASAPESQFTGSVQEIQIDPGAKLLDLDQPLPTELVDQATQELKAQGFSQDLIDHMGVDTSPARDVMETLKSLSTADGSSPLESIRTGVQAAGFDGYKYVAGSADSPHNGVVIFDPKHVTVGETLDANKETTPRMSPDEAQAVAERINDPKNSRNYDPEVDQRLHGLRRMKPAGSDLTAEDKFYQEQTQTALAQLKAAAVEDPSLLEDPDYKALMHEEAQAKQEAQVMEDFANCIVGEAT